jgi:hypothetical protein
LKAWCIVLGKAEPRFILIFAHVRYHSTDLA